MIIALQLFSILFAILSIIQMRKLNRFFCIVPIIIVFDFCMLIPTVIEFFAGPPASVYRNFKIAMNDNVTNIIFYSFLCVMQIVFYYETKRCYKYQKKIGNTKTEKIADSKILNEFINSKYRSYIILICIMVVFFSVAIVLMAPEPSYYLRLHSVYSSASNRILEYHNKYMNVVQNAILVSILTLKVLDKKSSKLMMIMRVFGTVLLTMINQKRTLLMLIVGFAIIVDIAIRNKPLKQILLRYSPIVGGVAVYFYVYANITEKVTYMRNWYYVIHEYFFRTMHTRFAIYSAVHPDKIHILDYPCQALVFDLFFFVPRALWSNKPHAYIYYFIAGAMNYPAVTEDTWAIPTSYYPEFVSNFGLIGLVLSIFFTISICRYFDKKDPFIKMCGIALISVLEIYYYDDRLKILAFLIIFMIIKTKVSLKKI